MAGTQWIEPLWGAVWRGGAALLDLLYPPLCLGCRRRVATSGEPLCPRCLQRLERADPETVQAQLEELSVARESLDGAFCLWRFDKGGALQQVQHALKYGNRPRYGVQMGRLIGEGLQASAPRLLPADLVVPVPLHRTRKLERGYNQSMQLARGLGDALDVPVAGTILQRSRATCSQASLNRSARWRNVQGAFAVSTPEAAAGRRFLLVDDLLTTGATAAAAAQPLKEAGAASVVLVTLAMAR